MRRYSNPPSQAIKNYYDYLLRTAGTTSRKVAKAMDITTVTLCNLAPKLDQMTGEKLGILGKITGVDPGELLNTILKLRKNPKHDIYFETLPKAIYVERVEETTRV